MSQERPARVLFLNSRSEYGGADMGLLTIVRYLDRARFEPIVVLPQDGPLVPRLRDAGADVLFLDICRLERLASPAQLWSFARRFAGSLAGLRRIIRRRGIDLVYTNSSAIQVGALAARLEHIPNVWHLREIWTSPRWLTWPLYRYVYALADRIIAISRAVALGNFGRAGGKIIVVHDGVDLARFEQWEGRGEDLRRRWGMTQPWPIVTSVARLVPQKGLDCLIEAARRLRDAGVDAYTCIAGDIPRPMYQPYKERLARMIAEYSLSDRVFLLGWCDDAPALLHRSDLFVLASVGPEGAGLVIPEAWLAGIPVVAPDHSGPAEIVADGRNGLLFRSANAGDLAEKIAALLADPARRRALAETGRQTALERHDAQRNTAIIAEAMSALLAGRRG